MAICFPSIAPNFLPNVSTIRAIRTVQIFVLELSKDGSAVLGEELADGGAANQAVALQGGVGLSSGQVSQGYGKFESNFQWFPKIGD